MQEQTSAVRNQLGRSPLSPRRRLIGWGLAVLTPAAATALGAVLNAGAPEHTDLSTDIVLFFLATVVVALVGGLGPALLAAVLGGLLLNYFLTAPLYTFVVGEPRNLVAIGAMVLVGVLVALVVDRAARRAAQAARARIEATLLADAARIVLTDPDPLPRVIEQVRAGFALRSVAVLELVETAPGGPAPTVPWRPTASVGHPESRAPDDNDREIDIEVDQGVRLVARGRALAAAELRVLEAVGGQALLALRHQRLLAQAAETRRQAEAQQLRTALLAALGHDLRTPLSAIKAALGSLRDPQLVLPDVDRAELLATSEESTDRLIGLVNNLLDSSRLATGALRSHTSPVGYDEIVAAVLAVVGHSAQARITVEVDETLPAVRADSGLLERVVVNLVDNALRHAPGAAVTLRARTGGSRAELRVIDTGPGVAREDMDAMFTAFQRFDDRPDRAGIGLGLHVARGFTEAMSGTLAAEPTPGGGLTMVLSLPLAAPLRAPATSPDHDARDDAETEAAVTPP